MSQATLIEIIGLGGPVLFLYGYAMISLGRWPSTAFKFHLLNFLGAGCILVSLMVQWNLAVCILEGCWASISVFGMLRSILRK